MSSIPLIVVTGYMILAAIQAALWGRQIVTRNASPADIGWSVGMFVLVGWFALNIQGYWLREIILLILVGIWSFRLSSYLITRMIRENEEDSRYARLRKKWGKNAIQNFFIIYQLQPIFNVILAIPILIMLQNPAESIGVFEIIGIVGWIIALIGESVADAQLNRFRSNPDNKGKICQEGLWAYSRHPNFFFEWCIWVSYFVMALSSPNGWLAIVSPAFMFFLLMKVTGIPIMEEHAIKNKGEAFKEYMRTTSFLFHYQGGLRMRSKLISKYMLVICTVLLSPGCSTVDIRPNSLVQSGLQTEDMMKGRMIYEQALRSKDPLKQWSNYTHWNLVTDDVWQSNFIRRLTPIPQSSQTIEFDFALKTADARMTLIGGPRSQTSYEFANGQGKQLTNGVTKANNGKRLMGYLPPMRDYFTWPYKLIEQEKIVYAGEQRLGDQTYHKIFVTQGDWEANAQNDQFIVWINAGSQRVEFIEFTMRDLLKSYRGVAAYSDYRIVQQMWMPYRITLTDQVGRDKSSHYFETAEMTFRKESQP